MEHNLADRLKEAVSAAEWDLLERVAEAAKELHVPLYVVGGVPRDLILGMPVSDLDLVVEGDAHALAKLLHREHGGKVTFHGKFGTAKWDMGEQFIDLITARSETYKHPAALPTVKPGTIADDLRRRDFTINALGIRLDAPHTGEVRDDFGGWRDIESGIVRVLHEGSFNDDPTRMYRAVRYEQRYGVHIADETLALILGARLLIEKLSAARIRHELDLILEERQAGAMLARLQQLDLLLPIHPALAFGEEARSRMSRADDKELSELSSGLRRTVRWALWLMGKPREQIESINRRLHFTANELKCLLAASSLLEEIRRLDDAAPPSAWVKLLDEKPITATYAVHLGMPRGAAKRALGQYLSEWRHIKSRATGHDLEALGLKPGPEYQRILSELRRARLDGEIRSDDEERAYLEKLAAGPTWKQSD